MIRNTIAYFIFLGFIFLHSAVFSQPIPAQPDPLIKQMVEEISVQNLEAIIRKLSGFETRHSLVLLPVKQKG
jgi:hypothetical protein